MNNDTHTEQRRQWVNDQQENTNYTTLAQYGTEDPKEIAESLGLDYPPEFPTDMSDMDVFDGKDVDRFQHDCDHAEALRTNALFDTLQAILDQAEEPRADLRAEYEDQANADRQMFDDDHTEALKTDKFLDMLDEYMESNH